MKLQLNRKVRYQRNFFDERENFLNQEKIIEKKVKWIVSLKIQ